MGVSINIFKGKFHREAFARAVNRGDVLTACFRNIQSQSSIRMAFVIIIILFDVKDYHLLYGSISLSPYSEKIYMTVKIFANVHQLMLLVLKLVWIHIEYSLV